MTASLRTTPVAELFERARNQERGPLARLLSLVERGGDAAREVGALAFPHAGQAHSIGLTGSPGSGKSTLTSGLITVMRASGLPAAVLAIDPSSPFTGGAILGDRVRMQDHALDQGVFIRSMATRGHLGGLALATPNALRVLDAVGFPWVMVETVGVGQVEVEVAGAADTTVVVVNPGWGDAVQANKAGLLEVADLFVINKADRAGVADTRRDLQQMLELSNLGEWRPPILTAVAARDEGLAELWQAIGQHRSHLDSSGELVRRRRRRTEEELRRIVIEALLEQVGARWEAPEGQQLRAEVTSGDLDPYRAAQRMLQLG